MNGSTGAAKPPLVLDLDGTLTPTDTLVESLLLLLKRTPWALLRLLGGLFGGRAEFKSRVAQRVSLHATSLPWRTELLDWVRSEHDAGRTTVLATAAHVSIATEVARAYPIFDKVLASEGTRNLKGEEKLNAIREAIGPRFVYAGDSKADLPIWAASSGAVLVGVSASLARRLGKEVTVERRFDNQGVDWQTWLRAIRVHQWVKNSLLFVPLLTSFTFGDMNRLIAVLMAFVAFSLAASSTYILNDLWDLENDRGHSRKRHRPFASGALSIGQGLAASMALLLAGLTLSAWVSPGFALMLCGYVVLTTAYSWVLKGYVFMDTLMLSTLYSYRVLAGAVAIGVVVSPPLLGFSVFIFLSLALVKRCSELELLKLEGSSAARGRDYCVSDLDVLWPLGVSASLCAVVVFGLYIGSAETQAHYRTPAALWLVSLGLIYWLARLWIKTSRGEMHDDPVVYALTNRGSRITAAAMLLLVLAAKFISFGATA